MKPMSLILTVILSVSLLPGQFAAPYDHSAKEAQPYCDIYPCAIGCPAQRAGCTSEATAQETFMVAQTQQAVSDYCKHFECTPLGCGPWPPEDLEGCINLQPQYKVEEQGQSHASKLHPNELLRWLKGKSTYDITFDDNNQITDKDSRQAKLLDRLLRIRRSGNHE